MFEFSKLDPRLLKIHFQNSNYSFATELLTEVKKKCRSGSIPSSTQALRQVVIKWVALF